MGYIRSILQSGEIYSKFLRSSPSLKAGAGAVYSNKFAGQAMTETVSATPVKAWVSMVRIQLYEDQIYTNNTSS